MSAEETVVQPMGQSEIKLPKDCKETRYYYKHREEILARRKEKKLEDPEYQMKQQAKKEAKEKKIEERKVQHALEVKERMRERAEAKAKLLGIQTESSGATKTLSK